MGKKFCVAFGNPKIAMILQPKNSYTEIPIQCSGLVWAENEVDMHFLIVK